MFTLRWLPFAISLGLPLFGSSQSCLKEEKAPIIRQVTEPVGQAEGPFWSGPEQVLYYVDSNGGLYRYNPESGQRTSIAFNASVGVVIQAKQNVDYFLVGLNLNLTLLTWDGRSQTYKMRTLDSVEKEYPENRFNDGKVDPNGHFWIGTMVETEDTTRREAALYRLNPQTFKLDQVLKNVSMSNGMAWSANGTRMFYTDSLTRKIDVFDYDPSNLNISNRRTFFDLAQFNTTAIPDGMTIDTRDHLWIALFLGSKVIEVSQSGYLVREIKFPVQKITSVAWGGKYLTTLYVTTSRKTLSLADLEKEPQAGAVFAVEGLGAQGQTPSMPVSLKGLVLSQATKN